MSTSQTSSPAAHETPSSFPIKSPHTAYPPEVNLTLNLDSPKPVTLTDTIVATILPLIHSRAVSCKALIQSHLSQIAKHDQRGLELNAVLQVYPCAISDAEEMDRLLAASKDPKREFPLAGIPFLVKDDIAVKGMAWRGGSLAFSDRPVDVENPIITQLRRAGAISIGKANLTELAKQSSTITGFSGVGGRTKSAYGKDLEPWGSSTGCAVGLSAGYCLFTVATQAWHSTIGPSACSGVVGFLPTLGTLSMENVICGPKTSRLGFMAKNVADMELVWSVVNPSPNLLVQPNCHRDETLRFGVLREIYMEKKASMNILLDKAEPLVSEYSWPIFNPLLNDIRRVGTVIDPLDVPFPKNHSSFFDGFHARYRGKYSAATLPRIWDAFLQGRADCPYKSLKELAQALRSKMDLGHMPEYFKDYDETPLQLVCRDTWQTVTSPSPEELEAEIDKYINRPISEVMTANDLTVIIGASNSKLDQAVDMGGLPVATIPMRQVERYSFPTGLMVFAARGREGDLFRAMRLLEPLVEGYRPPAPVVRGHW